MKRRLTNAALSLGFAAMMSVSAFASAEQPTDWPSQYKWHEYKQTAEQPVRNGRVKTFLNGKEGDGFRFDSLPLQHAVVRVRGTGEQKIALIVDPLCPYSRQYERSLNKLDNVTIYTFIVPVLNKNPGSKNWKMTERILCEPDNKTRAETYEAWIVGGISPPQVTGCEHAIKAMLSSLRGARGHHTGTMFDSVSPVTVFDELHLAYSGAIRVEFVERLIEIIKS